MFPVDDVDHHLAGKPNERTRTGIWYDSDAELQRTARHRATVLQREGALVTLQRSDDSLHCNVTSRVFDVRPGGQHQALAGSVEIAVKLLIEGHPSYGCVSDS